MISTSAFSSAKPPSMLGGMNPLSQQYEPMQWDEFFDTRDMVNNTIPMYTAGSVGHVFVCLHGAGSSSMTFAALATRMKTQSTIVSFDFRGHGGHFCENETQLSSDVCINDTMIILEHV